MTYVLVANISDISAGVSKKYTISNEDIIVSNIDGNYYAVSNRCGHMNAPLIEGKISGNVVECPMHHARFDLRTGLIISPANVSASAPPMISRVSTKNIRKYNLKVEDNKIYLDI